MVRLPFSGERPFYVRRTRSRNERRRRG
jgi:hypothetical protein